VKLTAPTIAAFAVAVAAGAAWPWFVAANTAPATAIATATVNADYLLRDRRVAFYERELQRDPRDQIFARVLADEYLQRFRETGDPADASRARGLAERSLALQPQGNASALTVLAAADLAFHQFAQAQRAEEQAIEAFPFSDAERAQLASILMERGRYRDAGAILTHPREEAPSITWLAVRARYDELAGSLAAARFVLDRAVARADRMLAISAYARSWFHMRAGQLAFEAGDDASAQAQFDEALRIYPDSAAAYFGLAKLYRAQHDWARAMTVASRSAQLYPLPATLAYEADAARALGDRRRAAAIDALIDVERHLYNAQGVNDREIALYYAQRRTHLDDALRMARADLVKRGDEIYADDTMSWVLAAMRRWREARVYALRATRLDTEDSMLQYHAGVIAMETGHAPEARQRLEAALQANPQFDAFYAGDDRQRIACLQSPSASSGRRANFASRGPRVCRHA
jgi:tetratricopeptide (TPR) repeat protein